MTPVTVFRKVSDWLRSGSGGANPPGGVKPLSRNPYGPGRPHAYDPYAGAGSKPPGQPGEYRIAEPGELKPKYIGTTNNLKRRIPEHRRSSGKLRPGERVTYQVADLLATTDARRNHERVKIDEHEPSRNQRRGGGGRRALRRQDGAKEGGQVAKSRTGMGGSIKAQATSQVVAALVAVAITGIASLSRWAYTRVVARRRSQLQARESGQAAAPPPPREPMAETSAHHCADVGGGDKERQDGREDAVCLSIQSSR
jgi:hypothetical protein